MSSQPPGVYWYLSLDESGGQGDCDSNCSLLSVLNGRPPLSLMRPVFSRLHFIYSHCYTPNVYVFGFAPSRPRGFPTRPNFQAAPTTARPFGHNAMSKNMTITFLGTTSGGGPTTTRNCSSLVVDALGDGSFWSA